MDIFGPTKTPGSGPAVTIRRAGSEDAGALQRLAAIDSAHVPTGVVLVAEVGGELWAALSVDDLHAISDPFRPSSELVWLLIERAHQLRLAERDDDGHVLRAHGGWRGRRRRRPWLRAPRAALA
jgi:hypothetical protein